MLAPSRKSIPPAHANWPLGEWATLYHGTPPRGIRANLGIRTILASGQSCHPDNLAIRTILPSGQSCHPDNPAIRTILATGLPAKKHDEILIALLQVVYPRRAGLRRAAVGTRRHRDHGIF